MFKEMQDQIKMFFELMASEQVADSLATMYWNMYQALKRKGFTDDQALQIVVHNGMNKQGK